MYKNFGNPFVNPRAYLKERDETDFEEELLEIERPWEVAFRRGIKMADEEGIISEEDFEDYD